uniref:G_PROTEIN_RECEP_F1_2 domain-containing protein n=1 Tax=Macrostomum lignano TaxID=282301 RepID=A0A1I8IZN5_9PLAT
MPSSDNGTIADACLHRLRASPDLLSLYQYYNCRNDTNFSSKFLEIQDQLERLNRRQLPALASILTLFGLLIIFGAVGNGLVVRLICGRKIGSLRSPRHAFVLNLALSDFILCTVTQPINVLRLLQGYLSWEYGTPLCKLTNGLTGLNLFVSTFSIMAIALDRFQAVVHPSHLLVRKELLGICVGCIWAAAAILASPPLLFASVQRNSLLVHRKMHFCSESFNSRLLLAAKVTYSVGTLLVQYLIPLAILTLAYWRIHARLAQKIQYRRESCQSAYQIERCRREEKRHRRTNAILLTIGLVFALSWLPLSLSNLITDVQAWRLKSVESVWPNAQLPVQLAHSGSLLLILLSACANPILYGFLNDALKTELFKLFGCSHCLRLEEDDQDGSGEDQDAAAAAAAAKVSAAGTPLLPMQMPGHCFDPEEVDEWIDD